MGNDRDAQTARLERHTVRGMHVVGLPRQACRELFITVVPVAGESAEEMLRGLNAVLRDGGYSIVSQEVFGVWDTGAAARRAVAEIFGRISWPLTWIGQACDPRLGAGGIQTWAVAGVPVQSLELDAGPVGCVFEDDTVRYCRLGNFLPDDTMRTPGEQTRYVLAQMEAAVLAAGMEFRHVLRTWFYNRGIVSWYGSFNQSRDCFFSTRGVLDGLVPASTAVGARHPETPAPPALVSGLLAVQAKAAGVSAVAVPSPLQGAALAYASSFSRAVELTRPDHRRVFVSGTASIDAEGNTAHRGDFVAQVVLTLEVVRAILRSRGMDWADVTRGIAHFKHAEHIAAFRRHCAGGQLAALPVLSVESELCRDDLLFELEVDAVRPC